MFLFPPLSDKYAKIHYPDPDNKDYYWYDAIDDNTAVYSSGEVVIANPPATPALSSPENGHVFYFHQSQTLHSPNFKWSNTNDWGWSPSKKDKKSYVLNFVNETGGSSFSGNPKDTNGEFKFDTGLLDGDYEWSVTAKLGSYKSQPSETRSFKVCTVGDIGAITQTYPEKDAYIPEKEVTFTWTEPDFGSTCAEASLYKYSIMVYKTGDLIKTEPVDRGQTSATIRFEEEEVYTWKIVATGPLGVSSPVSESKFTICTKQKPDPPPSLGADKSETTSCVENEVISYRFFWNRPGNIGKNCYEPAESIPINYTVQICDNTGCLDSETTRAIEYKKDITCGTMNYNITVRTYNGYDYSEPVTMPFSVCQKTAPTKPVINEIPMNYCRTNTEVSWSLADLGEYCIKSEASNTFELVFTKGEEQKTAEVLYSENGTYTQAFSLEEGEWEVIVTAKSKNGLKASSDPKRFRASMIPVPQNLAGSYLGGNEAKVQWEMDNEILNCENRESYKYIVEYSCNGAGEPQILDIEQTECTISNVNGQVDWQITLTKNGENVSVVYDTFNTDENCVETKPKWNNPNNVLISPGEEPVFGSVTFSWNGARPGVACVDRTNENGKTRRDLVVDSSAKKGYYVNVGDRVEETNKTTITMENISAGNYEWYVVAFVGSVTSEPTETKTFCLADQPPVPVVHEYNPFNPNIVSWDKAECKRQKSSILFFRIHSSHFTFFCSWADVQHHRSWVHC